ncbi:hypothetical protein [Chryseobacterium indoltheticum]|uniref:hypothetical protein n=1 Tax=Chryseobacterium indoltheticum TaxID=254 RepID=UPI003F49AFE0
MTITVYTNNAKDLLSKISKKVTEDQLKTWDIKKDSNNDILFSHSPEQWSEKAMLKAIVNKENLKFAICWWEKNTEPEERTKGYITGRFIEVLMVNFRNEFETIKVE